MKTQDIVLLADGKQILSQKAKHSKHMATFNTTMPSLEEWKEKVSSSFPIPPPKKAP